MNATCFFGPGASPTTVCVVVVVVALASVARRFDVAVRVQNAKSAVSCRAESEGGRVTVTVVVVKPSTRLLVSSAGNAGGRTGGPGATLDDVELV